MKGICIGVLFFVLLAGAVFAETPQKVVTDAEILLGQQQDRSTSNHIFLDTGLLTSRENRIKLNEYRQRFNAISGRIYVLRNRLTSSMSAREPNINELQAMRQQMEGLVKEHDDLIGEFRSWISSIQQ